jgi:PAS domain S-box-containing protein
MDAQERDALAQILFEEMDEALLVFAAGDGHLCDANRAALGLTGLAREQLIGQAAWELVSGSEAEPGVRDALRAAIERGEACWQADRVLLRRAGGEAIPVRVRLRALPPAAVEAPLGVLFCTPESDVARRTDPDEVRGAKAAESAYRAKSEFLAAFSHELRTPLTTMLGLVDMVMEGVACATGAPTCLRELRAIQQNGRFLLDVANELLDLSKYEAGKLQAALRPCAPEQVVAEVTTALRPRVESKGLALSVEYATPIPATIETDALRLRQILVNLLSNAIKFTERGWIRVRIAFDTTTAGRPELVFEVSDSGIGITEADQARLFEPFFRAAAPESDPETVGTGLGLAISRRMAELLGGRLSVRSRPGQGSTFTLALPVDPARGLKLILPREQRGEEAPTTMTTIASLPTIRGRILLAEDNDSNRRVVGLRLMQIGAEVVTVANGREAIDAVRAAEEQGTPFDLVLMDLQMPVLDGYEATRQLRDLGFRQPIVAMTAHARAEDREECLRFGCDDHISKPLDWDQLRLLLAKYIEAPQSVPARQE